MNLSFIKSLSHFNLYDAFHIKHKDNDKTFPFYAKGISWSRIDYIFLSFELTLNILDCQTVDIDPHLSDHQMVSIKCINFLKLSSSSSNCLTKISFNYNLINNNKWTTFSNKLDKTVNNSHLKRISNAIIWLQNSLNFY